MCYVILHYDSNCYSNSAGIFRIFTALLVEFCFYLIFVLADACYNTACVLLYLSLLSRWGGIFQGKRLWIWSFPRSSYISYVVLKTYYFGP